MVGGQFDGLRLAYNLRLIYNRKSKITESQRLNV